MEILTPAIIGGIGWIGLLAKDYYTKMAAIALKRSELDQENEQRRIEKAESYFELLLQRLLMQAGEQEDKRQALEERLIRALTDLVNSNHEIRDELHSLRNEQNNLNRQILKTTSTTAPSR
ncbi:hypothetical protein B9G53_03490 [Pseudanabaena sp. SR411]|uniref:hypothetical protein n=1 Tax=Pseudanabaena sp. SR411 TaxID=1980935 RepID=UPI000B99AD64|nr:hypothetical protein [Pseudanabaena sp. SR411]OYQ66643.1 hypothetical protein B9G53_03490 [Pseudanabaena sp. SR411]